MNFSDAFRLSLTIHVYARLETIKSNETEILFDGLSTRDLQYSSFMACSLNHVMTFMHNLNDTHSESQLFIAAVFFVHILYLQIKITK